MAIDPNRSFEVEHGFSIDAGSGIWIGGGDSVPTVNAPEGSKYFRTSPAETYTQVGAGVTNTWEIVATGGGDGKATCEDISQATHGFAVKDVIRNNGTIYVKAQADTGDNSEAIGIVSAVSDANNFTVCYSGRVDGLSGLTAGDVHFLSDSVAGGLTTTEPTAISKPILFATSTTSAVVLIMRGVNADDAGSDLIVQDEGSTLTTAATKINFVGAGVTVTEPVADEVDVTISGAGASSDALVTLTHSTTSSLIEDTPTALVWDTIQLESDNTKLRRDPGDNTRIEALESGDLFITAQVNVNAPATVSSNVETFMTLRKNNVAVPGSDVDTTVFDDSSIPGSLHDDTMTITMVVPVVANDYIQVFAEKNTIGGTAGTVTSEAGALFQAKFVGASTGPAGPPGPPGPAGGAGKAVDYYSTLSTTFGTSAATIELNTTREGDAAFTLAANEVTCNTGAKYLVHYDVGLEEEATNHCAEFWLELNSVEVPGTRSVAQVDSNTCSGSAHGMCVLDLVSTDVLRIRGQSDTASTETKANSTRLVIHEPGSEGAQGPTGSGSNVTVKDEGTSVTGTPHANLNFTGAGVTVTDEGGGQAKIDIPGGGGGVFGDGYEYAESEAMTSTTSTSFVTKLSHTTAALAAGDYRIGYTWKPGVNTNGVLGIYQVLVGATVISSPDFEADNDNHQWAGFKKMNLSGAQTIKIEYKSGDGVAATQMSHARIEIWRVS